ncbi:MAG TPA: MarR family winged helix-turn-helix transcriptional regulator [Paracoccaceae bacterium]|nr:MarR family winged helix-turn-helix transcriptional regulator [Paracoccaceae bacterium]
MQAHRQGDGGSGSRAEQREFLSDEKLRQGIELLFFAYRDFTGDPDVVLAERGLGRAHHRTIHFIKRRPGITVAGLLDILQITKQSLNRVLRQLRAEDLVTSKPGEADRRQRNLYLTQAGEAMERELSSLQRARFCRAYSEAGPEAVAGFRKVLERMIDEEDRADIMTIVRQGGEQGGR